MQTAVATAARIKPPMATYRILQNVSGVLKPGRITLLLGPPGGGKSMLMQALCGAAPVGTTGAITYNGHDLSQFNVTRTARYIAQFDLHNPQLTVRETLTFSAMVQGPGYNTDMLRLLQEKESALGIAPDPHVAELMAGLHQDDDPSCNVALTLQLLSLVNCADTIVGDAMTRGISGGERKRVTTGEFIVGPSKVRPLCTLLVAPGSAARRLEPCAEDVLSKCSLGSGSGCSLWKREIPDWYHGVSVCSCARMLGTRLAAM